VYRRGRLGTLLVVAYLIVGAFVAASHHYFSHAGGVKGIASAVLAILLWPLVLAGVSLRIR
jgi:hypothetical protein